MSSNAIAQHFHEMLNPIEQTKIGCTPNVSEDVRVMRLLTAYHKRGVELQQAIDAGNSLVKWCDEAKPLLIRGGEFEKNAKQVARWLAEMRAVEIIGGQHPLTTAQALFRFAQQLVGDEMARKLTELADAEQRKRLGHTGEEPKAP